MDKVSSIPAIGWVVILIFGLIVIPALFILLLKKGGKMSILGQTIEVSEGGKIQTIDSIGLMYL